MVSIFLRITRTKTVEARPERFKDKTSTVFLSKLATQHHRKWRRTRALYKSMGTTYAQSSHLQYSHLKYETVPTYNIPTWNMKQVQDPVHAVKMLASGFINHIFMDQSSLDGQFAQPYVGHLHFPHGAFPSTQLRVDWSRSPRQHYFSNSSLKRYWTHGQVTTLEGWSTKHDAVMKKDCAMI